MSRGIVRHLGKLIVAPHRVFAYAQAARLERCVVVGRRRDGSLYFAASHKAREVMIDLQAFADEVLSDLPDRSELKKVV